MLRKFEVTKDHIARGIQDDPNHCPIALCMSEALNTIVHVEGSYATVTALKVRVDLPADVEKFIENFDNTIYDGDGDEIHRPHYFNPFEFELDIPTE
jgi:hypothetical protein